MMRQAAYWLGCAWELVSLLWSDRALLGMFWLLFLIVEAWALMVALERL